MSALKKKMAVLLKKHYSPMRMAAAATAACTLLMAVMLFAPAYLGVANDSAAEKKMTAYGLAYKSEDKKEMVSANEYFIRTYQKVYTDEQEFGTQTVIVRAAQALDDFFTRDNLFDVRFLALCYAILWIPAVFLVIKAAVERVSYVIEGLVIAGLGVLILADVSYISYFNSLYIDPLEYILLLYIGGSALSLGKKRKYEKVYMLIFLLSGIAMIFASKRGIIVGIFMVVFSLLLVRVLDGYREKILMCVSGVLLSAAFLCCMLWGNQEFNEIDKFHSMTRGVLLESLDPVKTLDEFGIDASYSVLTDTSLYDGYPVSEVSNPLVQQGFLDQYDTGELFLYYLKHPKELVMLWDLGVKAGFSLRREYCGNYEKSVGYPAMGKSIFWSAWSIFKERSAPKTIGYVGLLVIVVFVMVGRKRMTKRAFARKDFVYLITMLMILLMGLGDLSYVILKSGDAALSQYNMMIGGCLDLLSYFVFAELIHKLDILVDKADA